jgi:hypothetical protein
MATLTGSRGAATVPATLFAGSGVVQAAYGSYTLAANPTIADVIEFCRVPAGSVILGGWFRGEDIDTGTETLDIDIGTSADPDAFGNFGVLTGDATTDVKPEASILYTLNGTLKSGPVSVSSETVIIGTVNAVANAGGTGVLWVCVLYVPA